MKATPHSTENTFILDNATTRIVASARQLEPPASLVTCHQSNRAGLSALVPPNSIS